MSERDEGFRKELASLINCYSRENGSDTPDFILADYLDGCLRVFDGVLQRRETWYGRKSTFPTEVGALASPAAAPAAETALCQCSIGAVAASCAYAAPNRPCECACHAPPSEPAALLPRVLAVLEGEGARCGHAGDVITAGVFRSLAAELRAYIAERKPAEKRIAELETAIRWVCGEAPLKDGRWFDPGAFGHVDTIPRYWWRSILRQTLVARSGQKVE